MINKYGTTLLNAKMMSSKTSYQNTCAIWLQYGV